MNAKGKKLLEELGAKRGYVLEMHRILAAADPDFLEAYEAFLGSAYLRQRGLDRRTKELLYTGVLTAIAAPREQVIAHMKAALTAGATPQDLLEVLEQILPPAGVPRFIEGMEAWRESCADADGSPANQTTDEGKTPQ
jgi:4-carboxymuconolactone decarboxylase